MSEKCEKKRSLRVRLWWQWGLACKAIADLLAVLTLYHQFNYIIAAPVVLIAGIVLAAWASSSCIAQVYGFWSNPWIVVSVWLWGFAAVICLLTTFVRCCCSVLYSVLKRNGKAEEQLSSDVYRSQTSDNRMAPILAILILAGSVLGAGLLIRFESSRRGKYTECDPNSMITRLERMLKVDFPEGIREAKAAKTRSYSWNDISFLLKFAAEPNATYSFFKSFPENIHFESYERMKDRRAEYQPKWFRNPISQGKFSSGGPYGPKRNLYSIYIDTSNEKIFIVYLEGVYSRKLWN
ncbi:MAG: YgaP family membrane protein [Planctomycetota bacterium]|jgi:hypothetical protein